MAALTLDPTNPETYQRGQGRVYFIPEGTVGDIDDYPVGNCTAFEMTPEIEVLAHKSRMAPTRTTDRTDSVETTFTARLVMESWTPRNFQIMLMGTPDISNLADVQVPILTQEAVRGHLKYVGTNSRGPKWTFDLPVVEFRPSGSLDPLADEWGNMEVTGEVIYSEDDLPAPYGIASADFSAGTAVPTNTVQPTIAGTARVGFTLTAIKGEWTGSPHLYAYEWQVDDGGGYDPIGGATASTYVVQVATLGFPIRLKVTATNTIGPNAGTILSPPTADVIAA